MLICFSRIRPASGQAARCCHARCATARAAVKKQGVGAIEPVTEEARKGVERHLSFGDCEQDPAIRAHAHAVARLERRAAPVETRMQAPIDHQHRPGLRRQLRPRFLLKKLPCLCDGRCIGG
jgi:hypothetical protein